MKFLLDLTGFFFLGETDFQAVATRLGLLQMYQRVLHHEARRVGGVRP
jgi:hypothetical protein